tara:strand:+ start:1309 stop:2046 length:738 start_codon:yes stop_codon:yes gene_type:complete
MIGIILAAGKGSRLGLITKNNHKALLLVKGKPLIEYQIDAFSRAGINKIYIITGYNSHLFDSYQDQVTLLYNPNWQNSNMLISIMAAKNLLNEKPAIISYSDIFYESLALKSLLNQKELSILYSSSWKKLWQKRFKNAIDDAETFSIDNFGFLKDIGEPLDCLSNACGQYMGILSFTPKIFSKFKKIFYTLPETKRDKIDVTSFLKHLLITKSLNIKTIEYEGIWGEVDIPTDLQLYNSNSFYFP